jgi:hypothetical protein
MRRDHANSANRDANSEDPMREMVALTERVELQSTANLQTIVAGFRRNGFLCVYWGEDPYYQFDDQGRLRRARVDTHLFRTQGSGLARLTCEYEPDAAVLLRHELDRTELADFREAMLARVRALYEALAGAQLRLVRQVPPESPVVERLLRGLETVLHAAGELAPAINSAR